MITVSITDHASPGLRAFAREVRNTHACLMVGGRAVVNVLRKHYRAKDKNEPNKLGGKRTHFWLEVARSVHAPVRSGRDEVTVAIADPRIGQKVHGGTITAKKAGMLTIPIHKEAHGRAASVLERALGIGLFRTGKRRLIGHGSLLAGIWHGQLTMFYRLVRSVTQRRDETALPSDAELSKAAVVAMEGHYVRAMRRAGV